MSYIQLRRDSRYYVDAQNHARAKQVARITVSNYKTKMLNVAVESVNVDRFLICVFLTFKFIFTRKRVRDNKKSHCSLHVTKAVIFMTLYQLKKILIRGSLQAYINLCVNKIADNFYQRV